MNCIMCDTGIISYIMIFGCEKHRAIIICEACHDVYDEAIHAMAKVRADHTSIMFNNCATVWSLTLS